jgi:hypothetical protein
MKLKHKHLLNLLQANDFKVQNLDLKIPRNLFNKNKHFDLYQIYKELGGIQEEFPHIEEELYYIEPSTIIILDDYIHFNRYRNITLKSILYEQIPSFPLENYKRYCRNFEKECIKSGLPQRIWANRESDYYFGPSSSPGDFFKNGSGGWKLLAFKDLLEDAAAYAINYRVIRFSVYDNFLAEGKLMRLDNILDTPTHPLQQQLLKYIIRRIKE